MQVAYYLKRPGPKTKRSQTETVIFARISYDGHQLKYYLPEKILPKFWSFENGRAKETKQFREFPEFNARLDHFESTIKNIYRKFRNDNNRVPSTDALKDLLDAAIKQRGAAKGEVNSFFGFFRDFIKRSAEGLRVDAKSGKPLSKNTIKVYNTTFRHLAEYEKAKRRKIDFDAIDLEFYSDLTEYLTKKAGLAKRDGVIVKKGLSTNAIGKHIQVLKLVLNEATERGINTNFAYKSRRFISIKEKSDSIYLSEAEVREIEALDLSGNTRLERVRDLFLIGCHTGLRYSDYSIIKPEQINNGFIETVQTKTGDSVVIPVHPVVENILQKYKGRLPESISNQKTNDYLKEIGKKVDSLRVITSKTITRGGAKVVENYQKWELLSTHTARRSFASNEYLAGTPSITIMAITGHRTEKAFLKYIKLSPSEHAKLLKSHWKNRSELRAV